MSAAHKKSRVLASKETMRNVGQAAAEPLVAASATTGQIKTHTEDYGSLIFNNFVEYSLLHTAF
jgi:hypothetical protein